jgi:hypothetical protein
VSSDADQDGASYWFAWDVRLRARTAESALHEPMRCERPACLQYTGLRSRDLPSLPDLFAVFVPIGGMAGAVLGLFFRYSTNRDLIKNVLDAAQVGALAGSFVAFFMWLGGTLAGG